MVVLFILVLLIPIQEFPMTSNQKIAIVTGGNSGIGRASTVALAKEERTKVVVAACRENHNRKKHAGSQRTGS